MKSTVARAFLLASLFGAAVLPADAATKSDVDKNKQMARTWYEEVIVKENITPLDTILAPDVVMEFAPSYETKISGNNRLSGIEQVKQHAAQIGKDFDFKGEIVDLIGEGNKVVLYRIVTQKLTDGKTATVPWVTFFEFKDGKIASIKHVHDTLGEKEQFEAPLTPTPGTTESK